jgi:hypothetical protein
MALISVTRRASRAFKAALFSDTEAKVDKTPIMAMTVMISIKLKARFFLINFIIASFFQYPNLAI